MTTITVETNAREAKRWLQKIRRDQIPFATSRALNKTADSAVKKTRADQSKRFKNPRKYVQFGIKAKHSSKRQRPIQALVYSLDEFQLLQEQGGIKRPGGQSRKGKIGGANYLAIPARGMGKITPAKTPRALAAKGKAVRVGEAIIRTRKAGKRRGKSRGRDGRIRLFSLVRRALIKPAKPTMRTSIEGEVRRVFRLNFKIEYQKAIKDGKPRRR